MTTPGLRGRGRHGGTPSPERCQPWGVTRRTPADPGSSCRALSRWRPSALTGPPARRGEVAGSANGPFMTHLHRGGAPSSTEPEEQAGQPEYPGRHRVEPDAEGDIRREPQHTCDKEYPGGHLTAGAPRSVGRRRPPLGECQDHGGDRGQSQPGPGQRAHRVRPAMSTHPPTRVRGWPAAPAPSRGSLGGCTRPAPLRPAASTEKGQSILVSVTRTCRAAIEHTSGCG